MQAFLRVFGRKRAAPGAVTRRRRQPLDVTEAVWRDLRARVFERDAYTCVYCDTTLPRCELQADHVTPRSRGGPSTFDNLATACGPCNLDKSDRTPEEWRAARV